jgi:putative ABC transport system permease protein
MLTDLRIALRTLRRSPAFTLVAVLCLGLGIGANAAMFGLVNGLLLRPLPFARPNELLAMRETRRDGARPGTELSYPNFADLRRESRLLASAAAYALRTYTVAAEGSVADASSAPERVSATDVSASIFTVLGVAPALGRGFLEGDDRPGAPAVVVIGHDLWQRRFGGDAGAIGRTILVAGRPRTIIGIMPPDFRFLFQAELWAPLALDAAREPRDAHYLLAVARVRPPATMAEASGELDRIARRVAAANPETNAGRGARLVPYRTDVMSDLRPLMAILMALVGCVLLIACANVTNLLLARAAARGPEVAVRLALGASRWRVMRQLLAECLVLAAAGGVLGAGLSVVVVRAGAAVLPAERPYWVRFDLDARVLLFTFAASLATVLIAGLVPALRATRSGVHAALQEGGRGSGSRRGGRLRGALVVGEVALSLLLLVSAGLLARSLGRARGDSPGFDAANLMTIQISLAGTRYDSLPLRLPFYEGLTGRIAAMPGVEGAGAINLLPLGFESSAWEILPEGHQARRGEEPQAQTRIVTAGFFAAMRVPLVRGRTFTDRETQESTTVAVVNEALARRFWPGADALGKRITLVGGTPQVVTVVGIAADSKQRELAAAPDLQLFLPYGLVPARTMTLLIRTRQPAALVPALRQELRRLDPGIPLAAIAPMEEVLTRSLFLPRLTSSLVAGFAALALLLGGTGLYGVVSYLVSQRRRELGIRIALGAQPGDVLRLVLRSGLILAVAGLALGAAAALGAARVLQRALYGVGPYDPVSFAAAGAVLLAVVVVAAWIPARRAAKVSPMIAMR